MKRGWMAERNQARAWDNTRMATGRATEISREVYTLHTSTPAHDHAIAVSTLGGVPSTHATGR